MFVLNVLLLATDDAHFFAGSSLGLANNLDVWRVSESAVWMAVAHKLPDTFFAFAAVPEFAPCHWAKLK